MTFDEFCLIVCSKTNSYTDTPTKNTRTYGRKCDDKDNVKREPSIYKEWRIGGLTGGGCWDGMNANEAVSADEEPDFNGLDDILSEMCPKLTFLHYRKIEKLVRSFDYTQNEYYGNYSEYRTEYIPLHDLYNLLKDLGYVE